MYDINKINEQIDTISQHEKVTKALLSELSRSMLEHIHDTDDIQPINRLIGVLTPMNRKVAVLFFHEFSGHKLNDDGTSFGKRDKQQHEGMKMHEWKKLKAEEFLEDPNNNIWTWAERNVKVEKKPIDFKKKIVKDVSKALNDDDNPLDEADVIRAIIEGGVTINGIIALMQEMAEVQEQQ